MLKKSGHAAALPLMRTKRFSHRDAWQFSKPLPVKILSYNPAKNQVKVEMEIPGRMLGSTWFLDANAPVQ